MKSGAADLNTSISALTDALHAHAVAALDGAPPATVVPLAAAANTAAEVYGQVLAAATGWSSPLGHLRRAQSQPAELGGGSGLPVHVRIDYTLNVEDPDRLIRAVQARFGDDDLTDVAEALRATVAADGWDPASHLGPLVGRPTSAVSVEL